MPDPEPTNGLMPEPVKDPNYIHWLKPQHLRKPIGKIELIRVMEEETSEYSDVVLLVRTIGGATREPQQYRLGLRVFSDEYISLSQRFGNKVKDWKGELDYHFSPRGYVSVS
jgi:hypothetical protein